MVRKTKKQQRLEDERAKKLEEAMRLTWSSLESHLPWMYGPSAEGRAFHIRCVGEYVETIKLQWQLFQQTE